jgi:flagellar hook assembly protein FlgD
MEKASELRNNKNNLLRRLQRQVDKESQKSPFNDTPEKAFLKLLKEELQKDPLQPKNTKLSLFRNRSEGR